MNRQQQRKEPGPIKIAHLLPGLRTGGCERVVLNIHNTFDRARWDSTIIYWQTDPELLNIPQFRNQKFKTHRLEFQKEISPASVLTLYRYLRQSNIELLQTHLMDADFLGSGPQNWPAYRISRQSTVTPYRPISSTQSDTKS